MAPKSGQSNDPLLPPALTDVRGLAPVQVAANQKLRLQLAMVAAVSRHGYAGTTLRELVALAGVSKSTFYDHFESKEECFLAAFDQIIAAVAERVRDAYQVEGDFRTKLVAALTRLMEIAVAQPEAALLTAVESLSLGSAGVAHREIGAAPFQDLIRQSFDHSPSRKSVPQTTVRAITGGIRELIYRHVREGSIEQLPENVEDLVDWALGYQAADSETVKAAVRAAGAKTRPKAAAASEPPVLDWREPPDSVRSRAQLSQRERIVRAIGQLVVEKGYETLSIPAISARAGTSNQTFYENFDNKRSAFLGAFDSLSEAAFALLGEVYESFGGGPRAFGQAIRAALEYIAGDELLARLTFFELQTAGPVALDRVDRISDGLTDFLVVGVVEDAPVLTPTVSRAIGGAYWTLVQHQLMEGDIERLPELAPTLARILLAPVGRPVGARP